MKAKVSKCQAMAIEASSGRVYDPELNVAGGYITFTGNHPVRFPIHVPRNPSLAWQAITDKLESLLSQVDAVPITRKQKLKLFQLGVCSRLSWDLTISGFPVS